MAAPVGNQFWKLRAKHGRDKLLASPELLWESACEYFKWCEDNPLIEIDFVGRDAVRVQKPKMRPFTWQGLELYLDLSDLKNYRTQESYKDFFPILTRIEKIIFDQKFTGAASGFLNPGIIMRDLGLAEKKEIEQNGSLKIEFVEEKTYETQHKADGSD